MTHILKASLCWGKDSAGERNMSPTISEEGMGKLLLGNFGKSQLSRSEQQAILCALVEFRLSQACKGKGSGLF